MTVDLALARLIRLEGIQSRRAALLHRKASTLRGKARETFLRLWPA